jgi:hypothetical protein
MRKFYVAGFVDDDYLHQGMRIHGVTLLGTLSDIPELIKKHQISLVLLADQDQYGGQHETFAKVCAASAARLVVLPDLLSMVGKLADTGRPASSRQPGMVVKRVVPPSFSTGALIPQTGPMSQADAQEPEAFPGLNHGGDSFKLQAELDDLSKKLENGDVDGARESIRAIRENMYR